MRLIKPDAEGCIICPECGKRYKPELPIPSDKRTRIDTIYPDSEPYQREQLTTGLCSDRCFDRHIGVKHKYVYDEKGRRFKNGERLLYAESPE